MEPSRRFISNPAVSVAFRREALDPISRVVRQRRAHIVTAADGPLLNLEYQLAGALPLRLERVKHLDNINHFPKAVRHASGHCRADFQRLVQPNEIVCADLAAC
jgi:hypothetical protein